MAEESLEPLITQCPTCRTRFRVTDAQLAAAGGRVRCGACLSVFVGTQHLVLASGGPRLRPGETPNEALDDLLDELRNELASASSETEAPDIARARAPDAPAHETSARASTRSSEPMRSERDSADAAAQRALSEEPDRSAPRRAGLASVPERAAASSAVNVAQARQSTANETKEEPEGAAPPAPVAPKAGGAVEAPRASNARLARSAATAPSGSVATPPAGASDAPASDAPASDAIGPEVERSELDLRAEEIISRSKRRRRWWLPVATLAALALLVAQVLYLQFDSWAKNPDIRPVYEWLCPRLGCRLPVMRSLDEIRSKNLVVRANPDVPGQLLVDALIVNQARFPQPFPVIELRFSSMDGRPIAALRFRPQDYLAGELKGASMFPPMTPVHIALTIEDPGTDAVSYYIQFR